MPEQDQGPQQPAGGKEFSYGYNPRGDLVMDGVVVEKNTGPEAAGRPERLGPEPPAPEDVEALRKERDELKEKYEAVEHFTPILARPAFGEWIQEQASMGEFEIPQAPPPAPEDVVGYKQRMADPKAENVRAAMVEYSQTLPEWQQRELQSNHRVFNATFDRFAKAGAGDIPRPAMPSFAPQVPMDRRSLETILRAKEVSRARVEPPGNAMPQYPEPEDDGSKEYGRAKSRLARARQEGTPTQREQAETDLVAAYFNNPKPRSGGY